MKTMKATAAVALLGLWAGTASADGFSTPPVASVTLKGRIDAAVAYGRARGVWRRSLVVGAIAGSQQGVYYYAYENPQDLPAHNWAFRIGSITKVMTASLLALQEGNGMRVGACGALTAPTLLRDKLEESCPGCDPLPWQRWNITIAQLATHHSGLPRKPSVSFCTTQELYDSLSHCEFDPSGGGPDCTDGVAPPDECADSCTCPEPDGGYLYSNWAFSVLGHLLADNAHYSSWWQLDRAKVLDPLGMIHTKVNGESFAGLYKAPASSCTASGCTTLSEQPYAAVSNPAGGLWSTGPDMMRFLLYAMNRPALEQGPGVDALYATRSLMFCPRALGSDNYDHTPGSMGLGWAQNYVGPSDPWAPPTANPNDLIWWKGGAYSTYHSYIAFSPAKNVGVFVLSNTEAADGTGPDDIGRYLLRSY